MSFKEIVSQNAFRKIIPVNKHNFIGYALPVIIISLFALSDICFLNKVSMNDIKVSLEKSHYYIVLFVLFLIGWVIYELEVFNFFPKYKKNKAKFRRKISQIMNYENDEYLEAYGKYVYKQMWEIISNEKKDILLARHTVWVCFMHCFVGGVLSVIYVIIFIIFNFSINNVVLLVSQIILNILFYYGAENKRKKVDFEVLDTINNNRKEIFEKVPENFEVILNDME